jgi:hypothetical protein
MIKVYVTSVIIMLVLSGICFYFATVKTSEIQNQNYHVSIVENKSNDVSFYGQSVTFGLRSPLNLTSIDEPGIGLSVSNVGFPHFPLTVVGLNVNSAPNRHLYVYMKSNESEPSTSKIYNNTSSFLQSPTDGSINYMAASYYSGGLSIDQSNISKFTEGQLEYMGSYSNYVRTSNGGYQVQVNNSLYDWVLNDSYLNSSYDFVTFYQLSLSGGPTGLGTLLLNVTNYPLEYFSLVFDNSSTNPPVVNNGALVISGFENLTLSLISYKSVTHIPYNYVNNVSIPYEYSAAPKVSVVSNNLKLTNSSDISKNLNGNLTLTSNGIIYIQDGLISLKGGVLDVGVSITSPSSEATFNGTIISEIEVSSYPNLTIILSTIAGALIGGVVGLVVEVIREYFKPKDR